MQGITITYNGITLGDNTNYYISNLDIGDLPIRQADQLASGRDGGFIFNQNYGFRRISLSVNIFSSTDAEFFSDIRTLRTAFARTNTPNELVINYWDGSVRRIDCFPNFLPDPVHKPGMTDQSSTDIVLVAPYPFFSSSVSDVTNATLYLNQGLGFDYPFDYPFDYVAGSSTNTLVFNNDGDVPALITIAFNGPAITPTLNNTSQGTRVQIDTTLSATTVNLSFDPTAGRIIEDQNGTSYEQYFDGNTSFFFVPLGSNTFIFTADTFDAGASCNITLTKYYLS